MKRWMLVTLVCAAWAAQASEGQYIAHLGDCTACHTQSGGAFMAGGVPFDTPLGRIYSTNITPDPEQGIGRYTFAEFDKVMRQGITRDGHALYPAMPYPNYALMSEADMRALYQYLMQEVPANATANQQSDIVWPLSMRWPLRIWNALFVEQKPFSPEPGATDGYNRGAYLVQGLGHCGACHTPRGWAQQEQGVHESHPAFLSGAALDGWYASDLRNAQYSTQELVQLLTLGRSNSHSVSGPMSTVITHSTQYLTPDDAQAMGEYLAAIQNGTKPAAAQGTLAQSPDGIAGTYMSYCAACHGREGQGVASVVPALADNPTVTADDSSSLLQVLLNGSHSPRTEQHMGYAMPGYGWTLDDQAIADLANFLRSQWGNQGLSVSAAQVSRLREHQSAH